MEEEDKEGTTATATAKAIFVESVARLVGHEGAVWGLDWHPTGTRLASCGQDLIIRIWSWTGTEWSLTDELRNAHTRTVRSVAFSPDGRRLAAAGFEGVVSVWSVREEGGWRCIANLEGHENEVKSVAWSSDGRLLATCGRDKTVWIWELDSGDDPAEEHIPMARTRPSSISTSSSSAHAAADDDDTEFECLAVLSEHTQDVKMVRFHPYDSRTLVSASYDDTIRIWRADAADDGEWQCAQTLSDHSSTVWAVDFSPRGTGLVSVSDDRSINFYERQGRGGGTPSFVRIHSIAEAHRRSIYGVSWLHSADELAALDGENGEEEEGEKEGGGEQHKSISSQIAAGASLIATFGGDRCVKFWLVDLRRRLFWEAGRFDAEDRTELNCIKWNPRPAPTLPRRLLAVAGNEGYLRVLSIREDV